MSLRIFIKKLNLQLMKKVCNVLRVHVRNIGYKYCIIWWCKQLTGWDLDRQHSATICTFFATVLFVKWKQSVKTSQKLFCTEKPNPNTSNLVLMLPKPSILLLQTKTNNVDIQSFTLQLPSFWQLDVYKFEVE